MKFRIMLGLTAFVLCVLSCNEEKEKVIYPDKTYTESDDSQGRFDDTPFKWDYIYSDSHTADEVFIGDLHIKVINSNPLDTRSGRPGSSPRHPAVSSTFDDDVLMILNPVGVYVGAAFPKSSFFKSFDKEFVDARNPVDIVFNFPDPFISRVTKETGSIGYIKSLKSALASNEYKKKVNAPKQSKERMDYFITEYYSYRDIEKAFSGQVSVAKVFNAKVEQGTKKKKINSKLLAKLVSRNFTAYMDTPTKEGFFKDAALNKLNVGDLPIYVRSLTYGKATFLSIESEYSFSEVKQAFEVAASYKFVSAKVSANKKVTEIFSKSTITILTINDDTEGGTYFMNGVEKLNDLFSVRYTENSYGYPVFCQGRYVHNNAAYIPPAYYGKTDGGRSPGIGRRPDSGRSPGIGRRPDSGRSPGIGRRPDSGRSPDSSRRPR